MGKPKQTNTDKWHENTLCGGSIKITAACAQSNPTHEQQAISEIYTNLQKDFVLVNKNFRNGILFVIIQFLAWKA